MASLNNRTTSGFTFTSIRFGPYVSILTSLN
jgi:hypothetical protein